MPELPEVEFARRCWQRWADGRTVAGVSAAVSRILRPHRPRALEPLRGATFVAFERRGKNLLFRARRDGASYSGTLGGFPNPPAMGSGERSSPAPDAIGLWSHLGMTGKWVRRKVAEAPPRFSRARIDLDDGHALHYCDMRLFGRLQLVPGARFDEVAELKALGPDPLVDGVDVGRLFAKLQATRLPVKVALLDQRVLAGVGNIQASESLHRAGIDPRRPARSLGRPEVRRLAAGIRASIAATLEQFEDDVGDGDITYVEEPGTPNPFAVYDRAGERCRRCRRGTIERIVQAGRSTFFCPRCQK